MSQTSRPQAEHELTALIQRFDHWRQTRTSRRDPIPDSLWDRAISLTSVLPLSRVAKRLRLNRQELKRRCAKARPVAPGAVAPPALPDFVEVTAESAWLDGGNAMDLEMERADGTRLRLTYPASPLAIDALVRAFLETTPCSR